jgi:polysaccharide deacetylase 2 family uncharacterized protein YibQ
VAIILDDAGGNSINYDEVYSIGSPFTISILPNLLHSSKVMNDAASAGKEVMLHLPMEPERYSYVRHDGGMVLTSMSEEEIRRVVLNGLGSVPKVSGVNNHMGSKATGDLRVMNVVFEVLKEKNLFFVDSRTASHSVAYNLAREKGIPAGRNAVFLDVYDNDEAVEKRLEQLVGIAVRDGYAFGIGHATRPRTIAALKRLMPIYEERGVEFVFASSLVK